MWEGYGLCSGHFTLLFQERGQGCDRRIQRGGMSGKHRQQDSVFVGHVLSGGHRGKPLKRPPECTGCAHCPPQTRFLVPERQGPVYGNDVPDSVDKRSKFWDLVNFAYCLFSPCSSHFLHSKTFFCSLALYLEIFFVPINLI